MVKGFLFEVFSSFQGEGGSIKGSCFGRRQIFLRFAGCNLKGCVWCDSKEARDPNPPKFKVYSDFIGNHVREYNNPADAAEVLKLTGRLRSADLHSISFTGGEPLMQVEFLRATCQALKGFKLYLETNGSFPKRAEEIADYFDYCCCDIKDESAKASDDWKSLVKKELETIRLFIERGKEVFAKVVFTQETKQQNIEWYARELTDLGVPLVLQPADFGPDEENFTDRALWEKMVELSEALGDFKGKLDWCLSLQAHKFWKLP